MSVALKVQFPHLGDSIKAMRFSLDIPILQVIQEIQEKVEFKGSDHGLFLPEVLNKQQAKWLALNHTIKYYNIPNETLVVFKKKHRPLKVQLVDGAMKTVLIDDSSKVSGIRDTIGRKLGLSSAAEYGLRVAGGPEGNWLKGDMTLYEQNVKESDTLIFDKSYYFFDDVVDVSDPVQTHLIYSKAVVSIIQGTYPVTYDEAIMLASIQTQAVHGDYNPTKHKPGFLNLVDFIPQQYLKGKDAKKPATVEAAIYAEHKKLYGTTDINAKYRYLQAVRQLPTYGITFFTVKEEIVEKKNKKPKLHTLLLGITREKIMRLDFQTKEVIRQEPLVNLLRWGYLKGKITFDWGENDTEFWTFITEEGEQISNMIGGYIEIIINSRKEGVKEITIDQQTGFATAEDYAIQGIATTTSYTATTGVVVPARANDMSSAIKAADAMKAGIRESRSRSRPSIAPIPQAQWIDQLMVYEKGTDDTIEQIMKIVTAEPSTIDAGKLDTLARGVADNLQGFSRLSTNLSAGGDPLLCDASVGVVGAVSEVLTAAAKVAKNPFDPSAQESAVAAKHHYDDAIALMKSAQAYDLNDDGTIELIKGSSKAVEVNVNDLLEEVNKFVSSAGLDKQKAVVLNNYVKQIVPAKDALMHSAVTLAPAVINTAARQQVQNNGDYLNSVVTALRGSMADNGADAKTLEKVGKVMGYVASSVDQLIQGAETAEKRGDAVDMSPARDQVLTSVRALRDVQPHDKQSVLASVNEILNSVDSLSKIALQTAKGQPEIVQISLETQIARGKTHLQELSQVAKTAVQNPNNDSAFSALIQVAQLIEDDTTALVADVNNTVASALVRQAVKTVIGRGIELNAAVVQAYGTANPDMNQRVEAIAKGYGNLTKSLKAATKNPRDEKTQEDLKQAVRALAPQVAQLIAAAKRDRSLPPAKAQALDVAASAESGALQKLMAAMEMADKADSSVADVSDALKDFEANQSQLDAVEFYVSSGALSSQPGQTREGSVELLQQFADNLSPKVESLQSVVQAKGALGPISRELAETTADVITAAEAVASTMPDKDTQSKVVKAAKSMNNNLIKMVTAAKAARSDPTPRVQEAFKTSKADVTKALGELLASAKGADNRDIDQSIKSLADEITRVKVVQSTSDFISTGNQLSQRAKALNAAAQQLIAITKTNPRRVGQAAKLVTSTAKQVIVAAGPTAGCAPADQREKIINVTKQLMQECVDLMENARASAVTQQFDDLERAAQRVGASSLSLENFVSGSSFPEVDNAVSKIVSTLEALDNNKPVPGKGRKAILSDLESACASLAGNVPRLAESARVGTDKVGIYAQETANSINTIISAAKASKYPVEQKGVKVKLDPKADEFLKKCQEIMNAPSNTNAVGPATVRIGQLIKDLGANARQIATDLASDKERQGSYINSSKALGQGVPKLVSSVKEQQPEVIRKCAEFLSKAVVRMEAARLGVQESELTGGPDDAVTSDVSNKLISTSKSVAADASQVLQLSAQLAADPRNQVLSQKLQSASDSLNMSLNEIADVSRQLDPGKQEISQTAEELQKAIVELDTAAVNAGVGLLEKPKDKTPQQIQKEFADLLNMLAPDIRNLQEKTGMSGELLQPIAKRLKEKFPELVEGARNLAATSSNTASGKKLLQHAKTFGNALLSLVNECYVDGDKAEQFGREASDAMGELLGELRASDEILQELDAIVGKVRQMYDLLTQQAAPTGRPYTEIKDAIIDQMRNVTAAGAGLKTCDMQRLGSVSVQAKTLARTLPSILTLIRDAVSSTPENDSKERMRTAAKGLTESVADIILGAKSVAQEDNLVQRADFNRNFELFSDSIRDVLQSVKRGNAGESKIEDGAETLTTLIGKLNTVAIFASAGQELEGVKKLNSPYDQIANSLVAAATKVKTLPGDFSTAAKVTPEQLGSSVEGFTKAVALISESALSAADKQQDNPENQQSIINATKAFTIAAKQVILSAKDSNKNPNDTIAKATLDSSLASFPRAVDTLVTVLKGEQVFTSAKKVDFRNEVASKFDSVEASSSATAVSVVDAARSVFSAASPLIFATRQDELAEGANTALMAIEDLLSNVKGASKAAPQLGPEMSELVKTVASKMTDLLEVAQKNRNEPGIQEKISAASQALNTSLENLVQSVNKLPGGGSLRLHAATNLEETTSKELSSAADLIKKAMSTLPVRGNATTDGKTAVQTIKASGKFLYTNLRFFGL
eukprot:TRINITY_DN2641_c0_g1_i4.p1 TRINITY_DN2641_c0_g1~~TRINITY_DN2641_c0_g1_i4.p1  ORF type:complete len:2218 (+),score=788.73 TRINITY_DN2641_c0_g1_i4:4631-11284(+)